MTHKISGIVRINGEPEPSMRVRVYRRDSGVLIAQTLTGTGSAVPGDTHYNNVELLIPGNGANNGTVLSDTSSKERAITLHGDAKTVTAESKWGGSSIYLDGTGDYLTAPASSDFSFGTGAFTLEGWCKFDGGQGANYVAFFDIRNASAAGGSCMVYTNSSRHLRFYGGIESTSYQLPSSAWFHFVASRTSGTLHLGADGTIRNTVAHADNKTATNCFMGRVFDGANPALKGWVQDLRITKGVGRVSGAVNDTYTVPSAAFYANLPQDAKPVGEYEIGLTYTGEVYVVALDDEASPSRNDKIWRTTPIPV
jgi:hypothetical protein